LPKLGDLPFYPVLGNHEIMRLGKIMLSVSERKDMEHQFRVFFLDTARTPVHSALPDRIAYSVDLAGGVHFIVLDNVSGPGFGLQQLTWLESDLKAAKHAASTKFIVVGMHKAPAKSGVITHAMDEDGQPAMADSDKALALFKQYGVSLI